MRVNAHRSRRELPIATAPEISRRFDEIARFVRDLASKLLGSRTDEVVHEVPSLAGFTSDARFFPPTGPRCVPEAPADESVMLERFGPAEQADLASALEGAGPIAAGGVEGVSAASGSAGSAPEANAPLSANAAGPPPNR